MSRSWWENEDILQQFRAWLAGTSEEVEQLPDSEDEPAEGELGGENAAGGLAIDEETLGEAVFETTQGWSEPRTTTGVAEEPLPPELPEVGLRQLVEAFSAMRQEAKLQTKGTRGLEESVQRAVQGLDAAMRQFQTVQAREQEAGEQAARPFVDALAGLDEALMRAVRAFANTHRQLTQAAPDRLLSSLEDQFQRLPPWRRWLARSWHGQVGRLCVDAFARTTEDEFATLMEGFQLIQTRLERTLRERGIQRMETVGQRADPTRMTVIEMVDQPGCPPETVAEEVRPGYLWNGTVVRFAEVRVARSGFHSG